MSGGFIIFGGTRDTVGKAARELEAASRIPLLFACDAERGVGQIVSGTTLFPFTMSLGAIGDEELVYRQASLVAGDMRECGLNLVLAPVVDINTNPNNPIINIRSYGDDPGLVSRLSLSFIKGLRDNGILSCAKHFPGHGGTGVDSHIDMPVSDQSAEDLFRTRFNSVSERRGRGRYMHNAGSHRVPRDKRREDSGHNIRSSYKRRTQG